MNRNLTTALRTGESLIRIRRLCFVLAILLAAPFSHGADAQDMPVYRSEFYRIHSDLDRDLVNDLARRLDGMYREYQRRLSSFRTDASAPALEAYLFRRQADYLRFTGDRWRNSGGVYMSGRNLLAAFLEGQGRDALRRTLQHEAFHQFAQLAISPNMPVWLNEGMAQLFEEGIWTGNTFLLGQVPPRRVRQLRADEAAGRFVPFASLLALSPEKWSEALAGDRGIAATQYSQSWAIVHFLVQARDANGQEKYRSRLVQMLELLHAGKTADDAFKTAFNANVKNFEARFREYARTLEPTPEATLIERQDVLADFLVELKTQGRTFDRIDDLREAAVRARYTLHYSDRGMSWSTDKDVRKYFSDAKDRLFGPNELFFSFRAGAALPDIVCRANDRLHFRTRFHAAASGKLVKFEHEVLIEDPRSQARADD